MAVVLKHKAPQAEQLTALVAPNVVPPVAPKKIMILGKVTTPAHTPPKVDEAMSQRQKDALAAVGLYEEPAPMILPKAGGTTIKKAVQCGTFSIGSRIQITNGLFPWLLTFKAGDTGTVTHMWPAPPNTEDPTRYILYEIALDHPHVPEVPKVNLRGWEIKEVV